MSEYLHSPCPSCGQRLRIRREYVGLRAECKRCHHTFTVTEPPEGDPPARVQPPAPDPALVESHALAVGELEATIASLQAELAEAVARRDALGVEAEEARRAFDGVRGELAVVQSRLEESQAAANRLEAERDALAAERDALAAERDGLREATEGAKAAANRLEEQGNGLLEALERGKAEVSRLEEERDGLRESLERANAEAERQQSELRARLDEHSARDATHSDATARLTDEVSRLQAEVEALRTHSAGHESSGQALAGRLDAVRAELDAERAGRAADAEAAADARQEALDELAETYRLSGPSVDAQDLTMKVFELEQALDERRVEQDSLKIQLARAEEFRTQMREFMGGLGIKLPGD